MAETKTPSLQDMYKASGMSGGMGKSSGTPDWLVNESNTILENLPKEVIGYIKQLHEAGKTALEISDQLGIEMKKVIAARLALGLKHIKRKKDILNQLKQINSEEIAKELEAKQDKVREQIDGLLEEADPAFTEMWNELEAAPKTKNSKKKKSTTPMLDMALGEDPYAEARYAIAKTNIVKAAAKSKPKTANVVNKITNNLGMDSKDTSTDSAKTVLAGNKNITPKAPDLESGSVWDLSNSVVHSIETSNNNKEELKAEQESATHLNRIEKILIGDSVILGGILYYAKVITNHLTDFIEDSKTAREAAADLAKDNAESNQLSEETSQKQGDSSSLVQVGDSGGNKKSIVDQMIDRARGFVWDILNVAKTVVFGRFALFSKKIGEWVNNLLTELNVTPYIDSFISGLTSATAKVIDFVQGLIPDFLKKPEEPKAVGAEKLPKNTNNLGLGIAPDYEFSKPPSFADVDSLWDKNGNLKNPPKTEPKIEPAPAPPSTSIMKKETETSDAANFISKHEGVKPGAYLLGGETRPTIGYGHQITDAEISQGYIDLGDEKLQLSGKDGIDTSITKSQAKKLLDIDIPKYTNDVKTTIGAKNWEKLDSKQQTALTSYMYNTGKKGFKKSLVNHGLTKAIESGDNIGAANIIENFGYRKGIGSSGKLEELPGLVNRRLAESRLMSGELTTMATDSTQAGRKELTKNISQPPQQTNVAPIIINTNNNSNAMLAGGGSTGTPKVSSPVDNSPVVRGLTGI